MPLNRGEYKHDVMYAWRLLLAPANERVKEKWKYMICKLNSSLKGIGRAARERPITEFEDGRGSMA